MEHPPYSLDLPPWDFRIFGPFKEALKGRSFEWGAEEQNTVRELLNQHDNSMSICAKILSVIISDFILNISFIYQRWILIQHTS